MPVALQLGLDSVLKSIWIWPFPHLLSKCICSESQYQQALNQHMGHNPLTSVVSSVCLLVAVCNPVFVLSSTSVSTLYFICHNVCGFSVLFFIPCILLCVCLFRLHRTGCIYCDARCSIVLGQTAQHEHSNDAPNQCFFCHCSVSEKIDSDKIPWVLSALNGKEQLNPM